MPATTTTTARPAVLGSTGPEIAATSASRLEARPGLPSGRAVLGGLLVTLAALGTYVVASGANDAEPDQVLTVVHAVDPGAILRSADLAPAELEAGEELTAHTFTDPALLTGAVVLAPLRQGAPVLASQVHLSSPDDPAPEAASHELSLRLARDRAVDGMVDRGERVDVLATYGTGERATTVVVVRDAVVVRIGADTDATLGSEGGITLTLLLPDDDAVLRTTHAKDVAELTLVRATRDQGQPDGATSYQGPLTGTDTDGEAGGVADTSGEGTIPSEAGTAAGGAAGAGTATASPP